MLRKYYSLNGVVLSKQCEGQNFDGALNYILSKVGFEQVNFGT
jgi:hypothetical protein